MDAFVVQALADEMERGNPFLRRGQALFNALAQIDPVCANALRGTLADPFYDMENVGRFFEYVSSWNSQH